MGSSNEPLRDPDVKKGSVLFASACALCHGANGEGFSAPALTGVAGRFSGSEVQDRIMHPRGAMPKLYPTPLTSQDVADVAAYAQTLH